MHGFCTIRELAREFGVSARTLRFYEGEALIDPVRRGRQRLYGPRDRRRLMLILRGKRIGFSLSEIAEILEICQREPADAGQLRGFISCVRERRAELDQKRLDIEAMLAELDRVEAECRAHMAALGKRREEMGVGGA